MAESIGVAKMKDDGTLELDLRAEAGEGTHGDFHLVYEPTHPSYAQVLAHLAPIKPGETKPVAPWPDES